MKYLLTAADIDYTRPDCVRTHPDHGRALNRRLAEGPDPRLTQEEPMERIDEYDQGFADGYKAGLTKGRRERTAQIKGLKHALQRIVDAYNADPHPIHFKVREAIEASKASLQITSEG